MKDKIITSAITLFNEFGVNKTTFRTIAQSLLVSDGHVRYYFNTKESLLLAIFERMNAEILYLVEQPATAGGDVENYLKQNLRNAFQIMIKYCFFFTEAPSTFNQFPKLSASYNQLVKDRKNLLLGMFRNLTSEGFFVQSFSDQLHEHAFYSIFIISDSWIRHYVLMNNKIPDQQAVEFHSNVAFSILRPYITAQ